MDILENAMPKLWQEEMRRQHFDCAAKGQAKSINFCKNFKSLDPLKEKAQKGGATTMASSMSNKQIPKKKRGRDDNATSSTASYAKKRATKHCMLHGNCTHTTNKCKALKESANPIECNQHYSKEELNNIIGKSIKTALKKECCNCACTEEYNAINDFYTLSLYLSNSNDNSHT
eukprot:9962532-Ditylum_brightwellii.AAC.1